MDKPYHGYRIITCGSPYALEFLRNTIAKLTSPWPNAKIEVNLLKELDTSPKAFIAILMCLRRKLQLCLQQGYISELLRFSKVKYGKILASFIIN